MSINTKMYMGYGNNKCKITHELWHKKLQGTSQKFHRIFNDIVLFLRYHAI